MKLLKQGKKTIKNRAKKLLIKFRPLNRVFIIFVMKKGMYVYATNTPILK